MGMTSRNLFFKGTDGRKNEALRDVYQMAKEKSYAQREIISEVIKVIFPIPATNASHERAASAVRPIKTFSTSALSQQRLNHCMIFHIHKKLTDSLSFLECAIEFISTEDRKTYSSFFSGGGGGG